MRYCFLLVSLCLGLGCGTKGGAPASKTRPAPHVIASKVTARDVPIEVKAPIDLRPLEQVDVGSKILGYVDGIFVERGDAVKKGQLVALVRPSDLPDQLAAARGSIGQIKAQAALARTNFERAKKLAPAGVVSQQELQAVTSALTSAEAAETAAQSQIAGLATRLGETRILSPIAGFVSARRVDQGALVGPPGNSVVATVVRMDRLRVFITMNELDATGITVGMDAHVEVDAVPGRSFPGKVMRVAPSFDPLTRTLDAEVQLDNKAGDLRAGMYGRGTIVRTVHPKAPVISVNAVQVTSRERYVFVVHDTKVERRVVKTGAELDDGDTFEITAGLAVGEEVVLAGADGLSDGATVRVARGVDPYTGATAAAPTSKPATAN